MAAAKVEYMTSEEIVEMLENQLPDDGCLTPLQDVIFEYRTVYLIREYYKRNPNKLEGKEKIFAEKLHLLEDRDVFLWFLSLDEDYYNECAVDWLEGEIRGDVFKLFWADNDLYDKIDKFIDEYDGLYWNTHDFILQCAYLGKYLKSKGYDNNLDDELILLGIKHWHLEKIAEYIKIERFNIFTIPKNDERIEKIMRFIYLNIEELPQDYFYSTKQYLWDEENERDVPILNEDGTQKISIHNMETRIEEMKENLFSFKCYGAESLRVEYTTNTSKLAYLFYCLNKKGYVCNNWQHLIEKRHYFVNKKDKKVTAGQLRSSLDQAKLVANKIKEDKAQQEYEKIKRFVESL